MFRAMTTQALIALVCVLPAIALGDMAADVKAHEEAFALACVAGDVAAVVALYADDARLVWPGAGEEGRGKADVERMVTSFCKKTTDLKLRLTTVEAVPLD